MSASARLGTATTAARIPYTNAAPFYALWDEAPFAVRDLVPRDLGREADAGTVDLGLMATGDFLRLRDRFEAVEPEMGVAAAGPVRSVLLFSRTGVERLAGAAIAVTPETSTSIRLLRLLLEVRRGLRGIRYARALDPQAAGALLAIGDRAMALRAQPPAGFEHVLDLGADWHEWTGLPFVYAIWAVRRALDAGARRELGRFLDRSLAAGLRDLPQLARRPTATGWSPDEVATYLRGFRYRLGPAEFEGLARFERLLAEHGLGEVD